MIVVSSSTKQGTRHSRLSHSDFLTTYALGIKILGLSGASDYKLDSRRLRPTYALSIRNGVDQEAS